MDQLGCIYSILWTIGQLGFTHFHRGILAAGAEQKHYRFFLEIKKKNNNNNKEEENPLFFLKMSFISCKKTSKKTGNHFEGALTAWASASSSFPSNGCRIFGGPAFYRWQTAAGASCKWSRKKTAERFDRILCSIWVMVIIDAVQPLCVFVFLTARINNVWYIEWEENKKGNETNTGLKYLKEK